MKAILLLSVMAVSACATHVDRVSCPIYINGKMIQGDCNNGPIHSGLLDRGSKPDGPPTDPDDDGNGEVTEDDNEEPPSDNHGGNPCGGNCGNGQGNGGGNGTGNEGNGQGPNR